MNTLTAPAARPFRLYASFTMGVRTVSMRTKKCCFYVSDLGPTMEKWRISLNTIRRRERAKRTVVWGLCLAVILLAGVCFGQDCGEKEDLLEVIRCLSRYVTITTSGGVAVYALADEEFTDLCEDEDVYNKIMLLEGAGFPVPDISRVVHENGEVQSLFELYGLFENPDVNPQLRFRRVDIASWADRGLLRYELVMELTARKILSDNADDERIAIPTQTDLTHLSMEIYNRLFEAWDGYIH